MNNNVFAVSEILCIFAIWKKVQGFILSPHTNDNMAKKKSYMATSKSDSSKSNRRKKSDSSNSLPVAVDVQTTLFE